VDLTIKFGRSSSLQRRHGSSRLTRSRVLRLNPPPKAARACLAASTSIVSPHIPPLSHLAGARPPGSSDQGPGGPALHGAGKALIPRPISGPARPLPRRRLASRFVRGAYTAHPALHSPELAAGRTVAALEATQGQMDGCLKSPPIQMLSESGSICGRLT